MEHFPEYNVIRDGGRGSKILKFVFGADWEQRHETCKYGISKVTYISCEAAVREGGEFGDKR